MKTRHDYLIEILFLIATEPNFAKRYILRRILYNTQTKTIYTTELMALAQIRKEREAEQERRWDE